MGTPLTNLTRPRWDGVECVLRYDDGDIAQMGDEVTGQMFRPQEGWVYTLYGGAAPHKPDSSGKVDVKARNAEGVEGVQQFYPSVIKAKWVPLAEALETRMSDDRAPGPRALLDCRGLEDVAVIHADTFADLGPPDAETHAKTLVGALTEAQCREVLEHLILIFYGDVDEEAEVLREVLNPDKEVGSDHLAATDALLRDFDLAPPPEDEEDGDWEDEEEDDEDGWTDDEDEEDEPSSF